MSRIAARFEALKREGRGGLVTYLQAYDPDPACSMAILRGLPGAGADVIELGVPFTDPMADGPSIQKAAQRALKAGATLAGVLAMVRDFRAEDDETPVVLMGYFNPVLSYGVPRFCCDAAASGVDGLIVVDVPPEEAGEIAPHARDAGLLVLADRADDVDGVAVAGVGVGDQRDVDDAGHPPRVVDHLGLPEQPDVGPSEQRGGGPEPGHVDDVEPGLLHEPRRQRVVSTGCDDGSFPVEQGPQPGATVPGAAEQIGHDVLHG